MESLQDLFAAAHPFGRATVVLEPSGVEFNVDVAETAEQRARGMIDRDFAEDTPAMLFIEPVETTAKFHMRGVQRPLVLAIFAKDGRYLEDLSMSAGSSTVVHAHGFKYALEMSPEFYKATPLAGQTLRIKRG